MAKEKRRKEPPEGKPRGRGKDSSSTQSQRNILEREQQTQETLRQSEEHYRTLAEQSLMGLVVLQDFHIIFANNAFAKIYGYTVDELLSFRPEKVGALVHPEDQALVWGRYRDRLAGKAVPQHYECRGIRKDGTVCWLEIHASRIEYNGKPAIQAAYIDITDHKQAEESLRVSEQNFRDSIEKSPLGIRIVTADGNTLYVNKALLDICGYGSLEELKAVPRNQLYTPESYAEHRERVNKRKRREYVPSNYEISIVRKDGQVRRLSVSRGEVLWDGEKQSQVVYQDITEHKQMEEALKEREERYRELADSITDVFFAMDEHLKYTYWNKASEILTGIRAEDAIGKSLREIFPDTPGTRNAENMYRKVLKTQQPQTFVNDFSIDGRHYIFEISAYPSRGGISVFVRDITERKKAEEALERSEERYRQLAENAGEAILVVQDNMIKFANPKGAVLSGYSIEELASRPFVQFIHPDDVDIVADRYARRLKGETVPQIYDFRIVRKDDDIRWSELNAVPILWEDRPAVLCFMSDITERKRAEEALRESEERYRALFDRSLDCVFVHDFEGNFLDANEAALKLLGYQREDIPHINFASLLSQDQLSKAFATIQEFKSTGAQKYLNEYRLKCKDGSFVDVEVIGAVIYHEGKPYAIQGVGRDITERKRAEERLKESEQKYRLLFETSPDYISEVDREGRILTTNPATARSLGVPLEELIGKTFFEVMPKEVAQHRLEQVRKVLDEWQPQIFEDERAGRYFHHIDVPIKISEQQEAVQVISRDITERRKMEERLKESEERYRTILEEMGDGYFETDLAGNITFVNDEMIRRLGYSKEELIGMNYRALRPKEEAKAVFAAYNRMYRTGEPLRDFLTEIICKDGSHIFAETSAFPIRNDKGEIIGFRGIRRDITERKKAEEVLRQSEEKYRALFDSAVIGTVVRDAETMKIVMVNQAAVKMFGLSSAEEALEVDPFSFIFPEDRERYIKLTMKDMSEQKSHEPYEIRLMTKEGQEKFISVAATMIMHSGRLASLISFIDITARKQAEEALRHSEERYRAILEEMQDSYFEVDLAGNIIFVNSAASRHLGYSKEELMGMSYKHFTAEDYVKSVFQIYNEVYRTGMPNKGFHWKIIRKDGSHGFIDASVTLLRNGKGEIIGFSGVGRDITERMKIEEQLQLTDRLASIGQLAAGIAHELNNPLTSVIGFSDLLLERDFPADVKGDLETVNQEARRAVNIVKGLLTFAREQRIEKSLVDINSIIQGVLQLRFYEQRVSNIEVNARFAPALPEVMGNGAQLQQVFINIIINAEQAMLETHGRGKLTITTERVGDMVRASITDDGPGISPDHMKKLFTPFFTTREVGKGTGLGLSICHGIVTENGGKIYAESELGKGATFVVELPISK